MCDVLTTMCAESCRDVYNICKEACEEPIGKLKPLPQFRMDCVDNCVKKFVECLSRCRNV